MAEYNSALSGAQIDERLAKVPGLEQAVSQLSAEKAPDYVVAEASAVVDKVMKHEVVNPFRFIAFSDTHQKNDNEQINNGNRDAGHGIAEILRLMGVDLAAFLGDAAAGSETDDAETVKAQIKTFNRYFANALKGENQIRIDGNHDNASYYPDGETLTASAIHTLIYSYNRDVVTDPGHSVDGYCYRDFPAQKVRVVCLNTNQGGEDGGVMEGYQLKWFAETALDMTDKTDWQLMILSHHPLDYGMPTLFLDAVNILDAWITGGTLSYTTQDGTALSMDYTEKNCTFIANFHGHTHSFSILRMQKYSNGVFTDIDAWEINIPNACFTRNNQNLGNANERLARFSTETTYNKTAGTAESTSFNVVTVDLEAKMIYLDVYGAGVDRELSYSFEGGYTNQLDTAGVTPDTYLSSSSGNTSAKTGYSSTGFIPIGVGSSNSARGEQVIRLQGIEALKTDSYVRVALYDANKTFIGNIAATSGTTVLCTENEDTGEATVIYKLDSSGNIIYLDFSGYTYYLANDGNKGTTAYFRLCAPTWGDDAIITVNEAITD